MGTMVVSGRHSTGVATDGRLTAKQLTIIGQSARPVSHGMWDGAEGE
jgi:hypothetical protein